MELGYTYGRDSDSQTTNMIAIHPDISSTLENTNIKQEPVFHNEIDSSKLSEHMKHVDDIMNTPDVKTEVIGNDHSQHMDIHYNRDICSNSNYTDSTMIRDAHVPPVKSEPEDEPSRTSDHSEFIIEIDTCKDEYYEKHRYPNNNANANLEDGGVEQASGKDYVTKEDAYKQHSATQHKQWAPRTSVDLKPSTVVLSDIRYTYPDIVTDSYVHVFNREPIIPIHTQSTEYVPALHQSKYKPYRCSVCGVDFTQKGNMKTHMRIHTGEKPYKCSVCGVSFAHKSDLMAHVRIHTGEKPHKCSVCEVSFIQRSNLTKHMRIHTGDKPHKCSVCKAGFTRTDHLTTHTRTHTGEKPYRCSVCGVDFSDKSNMRAHQRIHNGDQP